MLLVSSGKPGCCLTFSAQDAPTLENDPAQMSVVLRLGNSASEYAIPYAFSLESPFSKPKPSSQRLPAACIKAVEPGVLLQVQQGRDILIHQLIKP